MSLSYSSGLVRPILVVDQVGVRDVVRPGAKSFLARMVRDHDEHLADVVVVVALEQLMTKSVGVRVRAGLARRRHERWVDRDPDDVRPRRNLILTVTAIQHEVLTTQMLVVRVGVPDTDALEPGE